MTSLLRTLCANHISRKPLPAAGREDKKVGKYSNLSENYHFVPFGIEIEKDSDNF
jgi:hypothetical protein